MHWSQIHQSRNIKTAKIYETRILACFAKICTTKITNHTVHITSCSQLCVI